MGFFQNAQKPKGFLGKIMLKLMNVGHSKLAQWGFSHLVFDENARILDIGCGGGANIATWLSKCKNSHMTGLDVSEESVAESRKRNQKAIEEQRCFVIQGNVSNLPFEDNSFDYVSAFETIYFWENLEHCFGEIFRVLKPNGVFLICNETDGLHESDEKWTKIIGGMKIYNEEQISELLEKVGFNSVEGYADETKHWLSVVGKKEI